MKVPRSRLVVAALFTTTGALHLLWPSLFVRIMPHMLPRPQALVAISGIAEVLGAIGLLLARTRRAAGWGLILLLVAVFPANITMLMDARRAGATTWWLTVLWVRLPLQPLLGWAVWRVAHAKNASAAGRDRVRTT